MSSKITIIGAGSVGSTIAYTLSNEDIASEIVLIDINKKKVEVSARHQSLPRFLPCYGYRAGYLLPRSGLHHRR